VNFRQDPLQFQLPNEDRKPFDSNQAISTLLFERSFGAFCHLYPQYKRLHYHRMAFFAYPLSGGFEHPSVLPLILVRPVLALEQVLRFLNRFLAFRVLVVLEKDE
jgi:hypothetical protein